MANFFVYDNTTGEIVREGACPEDMVSLQVVGGNESIGLGIVDQETQYFDLITETVEEKMNFSLTGITDLPYTDTLTVGNIPQGTQFSITKEGHTYDGVVDDGTLSITFQTPGVVSLFFKHARHIPQEFNINAT